MKKKEKRIQSGCREGQRRKVELVDFVGGEDDGSLVLAKKKRGEKERIKKGREWKRWHKPNSSLLEA